MKPSLYPIALNLFHESVLVVGGGRLAARKLPELVRSGAQITVIAPEIHDSVRRLDTSLHLLERTFEAGDEAGYRLVFTLTDNPEVNALVSDRCRQQGILCNRADEASQGDFQVPGVIRRGSVTLTVSTGGSVPGLTRLLKRRLETLFGAELPLLVEVLGEWRSRHRMAEPGIPTREKMEKLPYAELMAAALLGRPDLEKALEQAWKKLSSGLESPLPESSIHPPIKHAVALVGAGPGHPDLITVMAADYLRKAEIILHDRLIPPELLALANATCLCIPVEKRGHQESMRQEHINALLIEYASQGKRVVRLKGGDPFVFGRGYEEILALEVVGLPWVVIPGLSAATAVPGWTGIPLTHRGIARSFAVMTGMAYDAPEVEIPKADTLVLLMGLHRLPLIVAAFLKQGYSPETPAVAIEKGTRADQRLCRATLTTLSAKAAAAGFDSPTLVIIGEVAGLRA
jgi:uroporphyrin-III C-methyltransferase / precorrin-2 dehydrogenase / sirohydrochlorin ferrochelatase